MRTRLAPSSGHRPPGGRLRQGCGVVLAGVGLEIARTHHEKWDGSGYPDGCRGDGIPVSGRIVAVADVYDALTHERPYKSAWPEDLAVDEIVDQRGRHFDPE